MTDILDVDLSTLEEATETPKRTRKPRSDAGQPRTRTPKISLLVEKLLIPWMTVSTITSGVLPLTGALLVDRAEPSCKAIVQLCQGNPKALAVLDKIGQFGPASELVQTGIFVLIAVAIETGRLPADFPIAQHTGITDLYDRIYSRPQPTEESNEYGPPPGMDYATA